MNKLVFVATCLVAAAAMWRSADQAPAGRVIVYAGGQSREIVAPAAEYEAVRAAITEVLAHTDYRMRLALFSKQFDAIRQKERAVELRLAAPARFTAATGTIEADRIFIPLSGDMAEAPSGQTGQAGQGFVLLFYGVREYGPGPLHAGQASHDKLRSTLVQLKLLTGQ